MDKAFFEQLLYEEEGVTLDFKREQYRFVRATDEEKSELLKDILGFANAWRRSEAYILIGVEEVRGGRSNILGIADTDHLDDHSLQQFVNNQTNRPVRFHYEAFACDEKQIGLIRIEEQPRPIFLKNDYGKLKKTEVYVRRGSSTDPTKPALPDEIAQMGQASVPQSAELVVAFADVERDDSLGPKISWDAEFCDMPAAETIPDLTPKKQYGSLGGIDFSAYSYDPHNRPNENYYRELANYEFTRRLFRPVRVVVQNVGQVSANNVRAELTVPTNVGVVVMYKSDMPDPPEKRSFWYNKAAFKNIRPVLRRDPGEVTIDKNDDRFRIGIGCGSLQPGRRVWSDVFYVGTGVTGERAIVGDIFAENLPQPKSFTLTISANVRRTRMDVSELRSLSKRTVKTK
ncbi:MAG: ATP-binding protein [Thermoguttaceae bacterium]